MAKAFPAVPGGSSAGESHGTKNALAKQGQSVDESKQFWGAFEMGGFLVDPLAWAASTKDAARHARIGGTG